MSKKPNVTPIDVDNQQVDLIDAGFERLEDRLIENRPPKIKWGMIYRDKMNDARKIQYLEKLAATMNQAASKIQDERNALGEMCEQKEKQLKIMQSQVNQNNLMLQTEITRMNAQRQQYNATIAALNTKIRELESGNQC